MWWKKTKNLIRLFHNEQWAMVTPSLKSYKSLKLLKMKLKLKIREIWFKSWKIYKLSLKLSWRRKKIRLPQRDNFYYDVNKMRNNFVKLRTKVTRLYKSTWKYRWSKLLTKVLINLTWVREDAPKINEWIKLRPDMDITLLKVYPLRDITL